MGVAVKGLAEAISESVRGVVSRERTAGIMFSGGLDSSIVALLSKRFNPRTVAFTVGIRGSQDLKFARSVSGEIGIVLGEVVLGEERLIKEYNDVKRILGTDELMALELGIPVSLCCKAASERGIKVLLSGHGADELFGGYSRYHGVGKEEAAGQMEKDFDKVLRVDVPRSEGIARKAGCRIAFPFLEKRFAGKARAVPVEMHFRGEGRKPVLRALAEELGVPESARARPKKAMQYGSGIHKALMKLRKRRTI